MDNIHVKKERKEGEKEGRKKEKKCKPLSEKHSEFPQRELNSSNQQPDQEREQCQIPSCSEG